MYTANAGCIPPIIRKIEGGVVWPDVGGLPLGIDLSVSFERPETDLLLSKGDLIILVSDGVVEAMKPSGVLYSFERFENAVAAGPTDSAKAMLTHLKADIETFVGPAEPHDDMTIVVMQV